MGLPRWPNGKESACQCRRHMFSPWVGKISWRKILQSTPVFLPGEFHGQRSLVGYGRIGSQRVGHDWVTKDAHMQEKLFLELSLGFLGLLSFASSFLHFKINIHIYCLGFPGSSIGKESACNARMKVLFTKQCSILCDPMNCNSTGSSVHGILQARILEWVAIPFSRGIFPTQGLNLGLLHCRQIL